MKRSLIIFILSIFISVFSLTVKKAPIAAESKISAKQHAFKLKGNAQDLPVEYLFSLTGWPTDKPGEIKRGPLGHRFLYYVTKGFVEGPKVRGKIVSPSGDWATLADDGTLMLDVRLALKTDDGADILMVYQGLVTKDLEKVHVSGLFQVGDERYSWLNKVLFLGVGGYNADGSLTYYFYALR